MRSKMMKVTIALTLAMLLASSGCMRQPLRPGDTGTDAQTQMDSTIEDAQASGPGVDSVCLQAVYGIVDNIESHIRSTPLDTSLDGKTLWHHQGTAGYWGTCGQTAIANTVNIATGSDYTEADIADVVRDGHMQSDTGGMTVNDMIWAYRELLSADMNAWAYSYSNAPSIDGISEKLEQGMILNAPVYGAMMREGGHTGEGDIYSDHWITLTSVVTDDGGCHRLYRRRLRLADRLPDLRATRRDLSRP